MNKDEKMPHTNIMRKAAGASNTNGVHTVTNSAGFRTNEATDQAPGGTVLAEPHDLALTTTTTETRVGTQQLAKHLGNKHRSLIELVQHHRTDFEQLGILRFQTGVIDGRGQPEKFAMLNEDQATLALDALPPPVLRARLDNATVAVLDVDAREHAVRIEKAETDSMNNILGNWRASIYALDPKNSAGHQ